MCDFSNADTFFLSALYSATTCYKLGWLCQLLASQEDAQGGAIIFMFKKAGAYRESAKIPRHSKTTHRIFWHLAHNLYYALGFNSNETTQIKDCRLLLIRVIAKQYCTF